jgi:NAD(P) transhydrogenase subunit alpha
MQIQQQEQAKCIADSDIVITTAQLFGRKPPVLINKDTVALMKPGSVIVDMAAENGGNVEGSVAGETIVVNGVTVVGTGNWSNEVAKNATQMYGNNVFNLVSEFWQEQASENESEAKQWQFIIDLEDDIQTNAVITHQGLISNEMIKNHLQKEQA